MTFWFKDSEQMFYDEKCNLEAIAVAEQMDWNNVYGVEKLCIIFIFELACLTELCLLLI